MFQGSNGSPPSPPPAINWGSQNFILPFMPLTSLQKHLRWNWMRKSSHLFQSCWLIWWIYSKQLLR